MRIAGNELHQRPADAAHMKQRRHMQGDAAAGHGRLRQPLNAHGPQGPMAVHHAFGNAGRASRVQNAGQVGAGAVRVLHGRARGHQRGQ
ncbi:hypothetical protein D3C80_1652040 [compost metagenome]